MNSETKIRWREQDVFIHFVVEQGDYILVSRSSASINLFKISVEELDEKGKELHAYLLVQVKKRSL